jgi:hypothetical protein
VPIWAGCSSSNGRCPCLMHAWVDREMRFAIEHAGDFWTLQLRIEHWVEGRLSRPTPELESSDRDLWTW